MPTLLHLDSSADLHGSVSRQLTARFAAAWTALGPHHTVVRRDLHLDPLPHLPTHALHWGPGLRAAGETAEAADDQLQAELTGELLSADVLLVGAPLYNWSVPSSLKAWIDWIHVPGITAGDPPPLAAKPAVIASARGLAYGPDSGNIDHQTPYLEQLFRQALGMTTYVVAAELTLAPRLADLAPLVDQGAASFAAAAAELDRLAAALG